MLPPHPREKEKLLAKVPAPGTEAPGWRGKVFAWCRSCYSATARPAAFLVFTLLPACFWQAHSPSWEKRCETLAAEAGGRHSCCPVPGHVGASPYFPSGSGLVFITWGGVWSPSYAHGLQSCYMSLDMEKPCLKGWCSLGLCSTCGSL